MTILSEKGYNVMDGEPSLGKQIETVVQVSREEYLEALTLLFLEGNATSVNDIVTIKCIYEMSYYLGTDLLQSEIDEINSNIETKLLDDDFGTQFAFDFVYNFLDNDIRDNWIDEFEVVEMR